MPYLKEDRIKHFNKYLREVPHPMNEGELVFLFTYFSLLSLDGSEGRYADYNSIIGALESAKLEFYRRAVSLYEDEKIKENGDVY